MIISIFISHVDQGVDPRAFSRVLPSFFCYTLLWPVKANSPQFQRGSLLHTCNRICFLILFSHVNNKLFINHDYQVIYHSFKLRGRSMRVQSGAIKLLHMSKHIITHHIISQYYHASYHIK